MSEVTSNSLLYISPLIGNGEIVTTIGPTGYHTGLCSEHEKPNRTILWAGKRLSGGWGHPLIRFGRVDRELQINGFLTNDDRWKQKIDYQDGLVISELEHEGLRETTESLVSLMQNTLVFKTRLENTGKKRCNVSFTIRYSFGDADGFVEKGIELRIDKQQDNIRVFYGVDDNYGEVRLASTTCTTICDTPTGGVFNYQLDLQSGEAKEIFFWVMLGDRLKFHHYMNYNQVQKVISTSKHAWNKFMALMASNHADLAKRVPNFRLMVLPAAVQRSLGNGAFYPWQTLENGHEGSSYGFWMDERFHIAQFSETVWQYYLRTRNFERLKKLYPVLKETAKFYIYDLLTEDENGNLKTRLVTDFDETTYPVENGFFTSCAVIRTMENAYKAACILEQDEDERRRWKDISDRLRRTLPVDRGQKRYLLADGVSHWHIGQAGAVFPFCIDIERRQ